MIYIYARNTIYVYIPAGGGATWFKHTHNWKCINDILNLYNSILQFLGFLFFDKQSVVIG